MRIIPKYLKWCKIRKTDVDGLIVHYISAININPNDPYNLDTIIGIFDQYMVSADFLIDREGTVYQLVPDNKSSYHCGRSAYPHDPAINDPNNRKSLNSNTIGVELMGMYGAPFTDAQYDSLSKLILHLKNKIHPTLELNNIYGHEHVATPLGRKKDPGPSMDWQRLKIALGLISGVREPISKIISEPDSGINLSKIIKKIIDLFIKK